ncbi:MAG: FecR domain-containing protein, partial [Rhodospirillales bacterium]
MVRVGDRSRATAALPDAPTYRIDQNTTFHLVSAPSKREQPAVIRLVEGALYIFSRRPRSLTINTPLVDAAVEGTEFLVRAEATRAMISVFEGTVVARNEHGEARATAGHEAIAEPGRAPVSRLIVRPRDAVEWALHY